MFVVHKDNICRRWFARNPAIDAYVPPHKYLDGNFFTFVTTLQLLLQNAQLCDHSLNAHAQC